ncbi:hypothetical protein PENANT_c006G04072 [Penicillium antarcticum]|uniref:MACPF domain-containing protein n=1 Tax=Penicillium antarcticum TaxID=416450 RepID=A0A1V6QD57_9EURO|nr:uncharacterized protein N7508_009212 [Penicillium antarcticum]KAJ5294391.1 hypothetical protein N7508_009212 [Penicillium antarcticum]OQD87135.1 hypothetical protein PENANT_c006G04072 [Penicillium antarcticum]
MGLLEDFPKDPFTPSLPYAAAAQLPVTMPWGGDILRLGTPLIIGSRPEETKFLEDRSAFAPESLRKSSLVFQSSCQGTVTRSSTSSAAESHEHTSFSLQAQVGGSVIGVSGRANYEARVATNRHAQNASFRAEYQAGRIGFDEPPHLSADALALLHNRADPNAFRAKYGDYYVGAYLLGGANSQLLSCTAMGASSSKDMSAQVTGKFLGFKKTKNFEEHEQAEVAMGQYELVAYDSLNAWECNQKGGNEQANLELVAQANYDRCSTLVNRVAAKVEALQLQHGSRVPWDSCEAICRDHLVVQVLLLPYAKVKEYASAVLSVAELPQLS